MAGRRSSSLGRGVVFGLIAGLLIGGIFVAVTGLRRTVEGPDCTRLSPAECALEREISLSFGRRQVLFGAALTMLGLALGYYMRLQQKNDEEPNA